MAFGGARHDGLGRNAYMVNHLCAAQPCRRRMRSHIQLPLPSLNHRQAPLARVRAGHVFTIRRSTQTLGGTPRAFLYGHLAPDDDDEVSRDLYLFCLLVLAKVMREASL